MTRFILLGDDPVIEELPEAEEVEVIEEDVAAVSADIDPNMAEFDDEILLSGVGYNDNDGTVLAPMIVSAVTYDEFYVGDATSEVSPYSTMYGSQQEKKEPEKTYLQLPQGKRIIILD